MGIHTTESRNAALPHTPALEWGSGHPWIQFPLLAENISHGPHNGATNDFVVVLTLR